jgi:diguanylate cyclase (GGDEF)-like protein/PAS domain S-box-containing protein
MSEFDPRFLLRVLDAAPEGIAICAVHEDEYPVVYVNTAFERLCGYSAAELLGTDLRRLQGTDRDQEGRQRLRQALAGGHSARAMLRNYRKDGTQFWNEVLIEPLRDATGTVTHVVGFHRDFVERDRDRERASVAATGTFKVGGLPLWLREDRLTGLFTRAYFEDLLQHDWAAAQREGRELTLLMFDIDALGAYNDTFGKSAGDACIRRLAGVISGALRRGTDLVARWEGGTVCALVRSANSTAAHDFAQGIVQRVYEQHIRHPRAYAEKVVTISGGVASLAPVNGTRLETLINAATRALRRARADGPGRLMVATGPDFD